jgi:5-histidylcysteine sulfoxide synthase/putative 4-mercaptohistidine N1-methyltranferase
MPNHISVNEAREGDGRFPRTPSLDAGDIEQKRAEIKRYFLATFDRYEQLFETLSQEEAYYRKPIPLRHPLIFYLGHTATFFTNKLIISKIIKDRINPHFESMFAVGVDEMSWDDLGEGRYDWPAVSEVMAYRHSVRSLLINLIDQLPLTLPIGWDSPWWIILMGIEHERIHLETSSVLIRQHDLKYVTPHAAWQPCRITGQAPQNTLVKIPAGPVIWNKTQSAPYYGWDNEYGHHQATVAEFQASQYLVSNQEFLAFVEQQGYGDDRFWEEEGRAWKNYAQAQHPTFWVKGEQSWLLRLMLEEIPMPWDWPVEVNYHEAKAFCNWKKTQTGQAYRLPTEDEWRRLYDEAGLGEIASNELAQANIHLDYYASSCPVTLHAHGKLFDVVGNVWQWTETPIYPFEGFEVHPAYDDFTTPTFDTRHNLIKGGSWISCGNETLGCARYAFRRHFFQHAGFRYVVAEPPSMPTNTIYETDKQVSEYAEFHYGEEYYGVANFPQALAQIAMNAMGNRPTLSALDLGCATGRATFELAKHFNQVTGIDFSARFIDLAVRLAKNGVVRYTISDEGELVSYRERKLSDLRLENTRSKVAFFQGDACNLKPHFSGYDLILAANLIDRLYNPSLFLENVHQRLKPGGLLLIASPYTWLAEHTPREEWLGGFKKGGENFTTLDGLKEMLGKHFTLEQGPLEVPFVIRETRRKFQHSLSEVTLWKRIL